MHDKLLSYLKELGTIDPIEFKEISTYFKEVRFSKGEFLITPGKICNHLYFVNEGCLRFFSSNESGQEMTRYFAFPGKFGTALSSFIQQKSSNEYMECIEDAELLMISRQDFYTLVNDIPLVNLLYRNMLEMAYITSQERIYGLLGDSAIGRLKWLMEYHPKILSKLSNKVIASYLGVTPFTLSRLKAEL
ncbi:Crp/Fnr family transcriptional regulator [Algoriphagus sp.]|uniref:Crp/Fnr family transcriptional regulator n=1 Tax=Algoriphagus sp. TaxID=1872435 RepID=UPI003F71258E